MNRFSENRNMTDVVIGLILFIASLTFLLIMHRFVSGGMHSATHPLSFPRFVITLVVLLSFVLILDGWFSKKKQQPKPENQPLEEQGALPDQDPKTSNINILIYLGILFLYLILLHFVGFLIGTPIIMLMVAYILHGRNFKTLVPMAIGFSVAIYYIALKLMKIILPMGIFFE